MEILGINPEVGKEVFPPPRSLPCSITTVLFDGGILLPPGTVLAALNGETNTVCRWAAGILNHSRSISLVAADEHEDYFASRICAGRGIAALERDWAKCRQRVDDTTQERQLWQTDGRVMTLEPTTATTIPPTSGWLAGTQRSATLCSPSQDNCAPAKWYRGQGPILRASIHPGKWGGWSSGSPKTNLMPSVSSIAIRMLRAFMSSRAKSCTFLMGRPEAIIQTSLLRRTVERNCGRSSPNLRRRSRKSLREPLCLSRDFHYGATPTGLCWPKTLPCSRGKLMHASFLASAGAPSPTASKSSSGGLSPGAAHSSGRMPSRGGMTPSSTRSTRAASGTPMATASAISTASPTISTICRTWASTASGSLPFFRPRR